jgi:hypothetical protein
MDHTVISPVLWHEMTLFEDGCLLGCSAVQSIEVYQCFTGAFCLHHQGDDDDGDSKYLWNVGKLLPDYTALQLRRQPSSFSPPWKPQIRPCSSLYGNRAAEGTRVTVIPFTSILKVSFSNLRRCTDSCDTQSDRLWAYWQGFCSLCSERLCGPPAAQPLGTGGERLQRDGDHSPPSILEVLNAWTCSSTSPLRHRGMTLGHRDNVTLCTEKPWELLFILATNSKTLKIRETKHEQCQLFCMGAKHGLILWGKNILFEAFESKALRNVFGQKKDRVIGKFREQRWLSSGMLRRVLP